MHRKEAAVKLLLSQRLLPLYYENGEEESIKILEALYDGGIRMVEYTNRGDQAVKNFTALKKLSQSLPELQLGIGTIKTTSEAIKFINAGADFIVSPTINEEVGHVTSSAGLLWIP